MYKGTHAHTGALAGVLLDREGPAASWVLQWTLGLLTVHSKASSRLWKGAAGLWLHVTPHWGCQPSNAPHRGSERWALGLNVGLCGNSITAQHLLTCASSTMTSLHSHPCPLSLQTGTQTLGTLQRGGRRRQSPVLTATTGGRA
jgi:hypothetical protein